MIENNIKEIGTQNWLNVFQKRVSEDISQMQMMGHCKEMHYNQTDEDLIKRIEEEDKRYASSFYDEAKIDSYITVTLLNNKEAIAEWLSGIPEANDLVLRMPNADVVPVGYGFNSNKEEFVTKDVKIVLSANKDNQSSEFGFIIKTAYADIESINAQREGRAWKTGYQYHEGDNRKIIKAEIPDLKRDSERSTKNFIQRLSSFISKVIKSLKAGFAYVFPSFPFADEAKKYNPMLDEELSKKKEEESVEIKDDNGKPMKIKEEEEIHEKRDIHDKKKKSDINVMKENAKVYIESIGSDFVKDTFYHTTFHENNKTSILNEFFESLSKETISRLPESGIDNINFDFSFDEQGIQVDMHTQFDDNDTFTNSFCIDKETAESIMNDIDDMLEMDDLTNEFQPDEEDLIQ